MKSERIAETGGVGGANSSGQRIQMFAAGELRSQLLLHLSTSVSCIRSTLQRTSILTEALRLPDRVFTPVEVSVNT